MNIEVRYYTRSGNTKKLAEAIAASVGAAAENVTCDLKERADILFLGSSVYAGKFDPEVGEFVERNADKIGLIINFSSSVSGKSTYKKIKELAEANGISVCDEHFVCPGEFLFMYKKRPNENDLAKAALFASKIKENYK